MNIAGKKVAYITLGCKLNFSETSTIRHSLEKEGTETVADKEGADIFVINTCSVTDMAEKKGRQLIRKIIHHNPGAYIVVVGCYAQLRAKEIMAIDGVSLVLGAGEKFNVAHYLQHLEEQEKQEPHSCDIFKISNFDLAYSFGDRTRCFLKIQDGCDYFCTYCTIPFARGRSRSASLPRILDALHEVAGKGIQEVIAGMRGETEACFEDALRFIETLDISRLHVFPYSERQGTKALDIPLIVPQEEKHRRVNRLISVSQKKLTAFYHRFEGETRPVLFEDNKIGQYICGFTDNYIKVKLPYDAGLANRIIPIRLEKGLFCEDE